MSELTMRWSDVSGLKAMNKALKVLGSKRFAGVSARAINHSGAKGRTQSKKKLVAQTGLKSKTINKAMRVRRASAANVSYVIKATGGDISLRHFGARETRRGVSAKPFNQRQIFRGTFIKGGRFPARVGLGLKGQVFKRDGKARLGISNIKSGVIIPKEMVRGETAKAWQGTIARFLPQRFGHEVRRATGKVFG
ncbi:phage tail protein [Roseibium algae]|uniref:Phage tail protein n=1 Tax=Roseibium algae TaxID=3123038 RepID=A0ABU8TJX9_9HYPH